MARRSLPFLLLCLGSLVQASTFDTPEILAKTGKSGNTVVPLPKLQPDATYELLYSLAKPGVLARGVRVEVTLENNGAVLAQKTLHMGDPDVFFPFHVAQESRPQVRISSPALDSTYTLRISQWPASRSLKQGLNHSWRTANEMTLGTTVYASSDENEYMPLPDESRENIAHAQAGEDWYKFEFNSARPKLVFFQIELTDRDFIPPDVSIFRVVDGKPVEYTEGQDPVTAPHEVQALPANKFTPRVLKQKGTYYVRVRANHPGYKLVTRTYDVPPYSDPRQAVRTAADYIIAAGDSWFANTPRRGGLLDRATSVHQETSLCVACHVSHFSQRAQLYSAVHGYPVNQRDELKFLTDRFYNNPRPFYGFEKDGAVWARVISAPANVLSRMSVLMDVYEQQISMESRPAWHDAINKYLNLYYADRTTLPPDETNGNKPLVSTFEVAWYSWKLTRNPKLDDMIAQGEVKNMIDLCYQTQALADMDRTKYRGQIQKNVERILSLQRPDGQWSMQFDPQQPEVEFQTGHALWALASAGVPATNPQVKKGLDYLLNRQQSFGGWMDPLQSFENFRTPFRETQFAVLALSAYYPKSGRLPGWDSPEPKKLSRNPLELLQQLDRVWDRPSPELLAQIENALASNDVMVRRAAAEALGRVAIPSTASSLTPLLGDESKLVQRTAAWSLRQIYSRHTDTAASYLLTSLSSSETRERWGAARVFAHHFSALARRNELAEGLEKLTADPVIPVRLEAVQGLWQTWFWNADPQLRGQIEDTVIAGLAGKQDPWVEQNLHAALYNLADENIRYLYNNWIPLLGREQDRDQAIRGRLAIESQLAKKLALALENGPANSKKEILSALAAFPQRRADIYDLSADLSQPSPVVYNRIGNDVEQIAFFGPSAEKLAKALLPLLDSSDPEMRHLAERASLIVRPVRFQTVNALAGSEGASVKLLEAKLDSTPEAADVAKAFHPAPPSKSKTAAYPANWTPHRGNAKLDEAYFHAYVEPIFHTKGPDGYACANCHSTHTLFNATWATVMNVVNTDDPEQSLILRKPTSTAESEGIAGAKQLSHGGGQRFTKDSPQYETILKWIQGAKLEKASVSHK
jgi:hypothetical protein